MIDGRLDRDVLVRLRQPVAFRHIDHLRVRRHELVGTILSAHAAWIAVATAALSSIRRSALRYLSTLKEVSR